jgi:molybdopterin-biosynthesis enzyme MoeA-like protein
VEFSISYDHVFTSGGVGPTHDDVTMAGIARGFSVRLVRHPDIEKILCIRYNDRLNEAVLKMAEVPEGSEIISLGERRFPIVSFKNIFIFPGIPEHLMAKFAAIKERFRSSAFYSRRFFLNASESDIADILKKVVTMNSGVAIGSYPVVGNPKYKIIVTAESRSAECLDRAFNELINRFPEDILVRVE